MTPETLAALKASIAKWDKNARVRNTDNAKTCAEDCPLCHLFHEDFGADRSDCSGCPVAKKTGEPFCWKSPYSKASQAHFRGDAKAFRDAAKAEAAFLRSLLPEATL